MVTIIVAHDENRVIGNKNDIPWYIPQDLKLFKDRTMGHAVIMGRKTYLSIPEKYRPLKGRMSIVLTRDVQEDKKVIHPLENNTGAVMCSTMESAIEEGFKWGEEIFIAGGSQIYQLALDSGVVDKAIVSLVKGDHEGDTFFPELDWPYEIIGEYDSFKVLEYRRPW